jgi:hypothetical protein
MIMTRICKLNIDLLKIASNEANEDGYKVVNCHTFYNDFFSTEVITYRVDFVDHCHLSKVIKQLMDKQLEKSFESIFVYMNRVVLKPEELKEHAHDYNIIMLHEYQIR